MFFRILKKKNCWKFCFQFFRFLEQMRFKKKLILNFFDFFSNFEKKKNLNKKFWNKLDIKK